MENASLAAHLRRFVIQIVLLETRPVYGYPRANPGIHHAGREESIFPFQNTSRIMVAALPTGGETRSYMEGR